MAKKVSDFKQKVSTSEIASEIKVKKPDDNTDAALKENFDDLLKREDYESRRQDREERLKYARYIYWMIVLWLIAIVCFIYFQGTQKVPIFKHSFNLSEKVLITLITTTTINVVTFFTIVAKYLFPDPAGKPKKKEKKKPTKVPK